jgi:hypothetical protein
MRTLFAWVMIGIVAGCVPGRSNPWDNRACDPPCSKDEYCFEGRCAPFVDGGADGSKPSDQSSDHDGSKDQGAAQDKSVAQDKGLIKDGSALDSSPTDGIVPLDSSATDVGGDLDPAISWSVTPLSSTAIFANSLGAFTSTELWWELKNNGSVSFAYTVDVSESWLSGKVSQPTVLNPGDKSAIMIKIETSKVLQLKAGVHNASVAIKIASASDSQGISLTLYNSGNAYWKKYTGTGAAQLPVLTLGTPGSLDLKGIEHPVVRRSGNQYTMWYVGRDSVDQQRLLHATSTDGIAWSKAYQPLALSPAPASGDWDEYLYYGLDIVLDQATSIYHMYYAAQNPSSASGIGHATSTDGLAWTRLSTSSALLTTGSSSAWDDFELRSVAAVVSGQEHRLWYSASQLGVNKVQIGTAFSTDGGGSFSKDPANPVIPAPLTGHYGDWGISVLQDELGYQLWIIDSTGTSVPVSLFSSNGLNWTLPSAQLLVPVAGEIDAYGYRQLCVIRDAQDGHKMKMWYGAVDDQNTNRFGYAVSDLPSTPP